MNSGYSIEKLHKGRDALLVEWIGHRDAFIEFTLRLLNSPNGVEVYMRPVAINTCKSRSSEKTVHPPTWVISLMLNKHFAWKTPKMVERDCYSGRGRH